MKAHATRALKGFTLVEVLIASTLGALVLSAVLSSLVFLARNFTRLANQQALDQQSRQALGWLQGDVALAKSVKRGSSPGSTSVTLVLPAGEVTYSYDAAGQRLRRQADFGDVRDLTLLRSNTTRCVSFAFSYFTAANGSPADPFAPGTIVPYNVKQLQASFRLETDSSESAQTRRGQDVVSSRLALRHQQAPDGN